jgi:hypothetical protein
MAMLSHAKEVAGLIEQAAPIRLELSSNQNRSRLQETPNIAFPASSATLFSSLF